MTGMDLYDPPIIRIGRSDDPLFEKLKDEGVIGPHFMLPGEWLPDAKSVISIFFPTAEHTRRSNAERMDLPSPDWLHARYEGQKMIEQVAVILKEGLEQLGFSAMIPVHDGRFATSYGKNRPPELPEYTSNWSERHVAFVCGHGTFGLSKGLITSRGVAGRFVSLITSAELAYDERDYTGVYEYCSMCGACAKNCPVGAISLENGKDHDKCDEFLEKTLEMYRPSYGCGKCQVKVPCEQQRPAAPKRACGRRTGV